MTAKALKVGLALPVAFVAWLYLPPFGSAVSLPELEPILDPGVPHAPPEFIDTGDHVYYRSAFTVPVSPTFSWDYFQRLHQQGVQFWDVTTSPYRFIQRRKGWKIALVWEKNLEPYTVGYRKSTDRSPWFFIKLRWPWLYFRLGRDVLKPWEAVVVPEVDRVAVSPLVPRYPGSVLADSNLTKLDSHVVYFRFVAPTEGRTILDYYTAFLTRYVPEQPHRDARNVSIESPSGQFAAQLGAPVAAEVNIGTMLFTDDALVIFAPDEALKLPRDSNVLQPEGLRHLPFVSTYFLRLRYPNREAALQAARVFRDDRGGIE